MCWSASKTHLFRRHAFAQRRALALPRHRLGLSTQPPPDRATMLLLQFVKTRMQYYKAPHIFMYSYWIWSVFVFLKLFMFSICFGYMKIQGDPT